MSICIFQSLWNAHKPNFMLMPSATPTLLGQKKSKLFGKPKFFCSIVFRFIDILLKLQQHTLMCFCKFNCNSESQVFYLFWRNNVVFPTTGRLNISRQGVVSHKTSSYSTWFGIKFSTHYAYVETLKAIMWSKKL